MFKRLLTNRYVLYLTAFLALTNVIGYLMKQDIKALTFFLVVGVLSSYFSKNMIVNLLVATLSTNILIANKSIHEGMKGGGSEAATSRARPLLVEL